MQQRIVLIKIKQAVGHGKGTLAFGRRELTSDEVRNVLMSLELNEGAKCGKLQGHKDEIMAGLINEGGMPAH